MPSTTSSVVSIVFASSTVITPSLPTLSMAPAMIVPMVSSLLAEMVPTCATIDPVTGFDIPLDAAPQFHRIRAGDDVLRAFAIDRLRQDGGGRRAVAGDVGRLARHL